MSLNNEEQLFKSLEFSEPEEDTDDVIDRIFSAKCEDCPVLQDIANMLSKVLTQVRPLREKSIRLFDEPLDVSRARYATKVASEIIDLCVQNEKRMVAENLTNKEATVSRLTRQIDEFGGACQGVSTTHENDDTHKYTTDSCRSDKAYADPCSELRTAHTIRRPL